MLLQGAYVTPSFHNDHDGRRGGVKWLSASELAADHAQFALIQVLLNAPEPDMELVESF